MKGDFSRFSYDPSKHYTGVLKQQGRVDLDADWNEYVVIQDHLRRTMETDLIGGSGVPDRDGGFKIGWEDGDQRDLTVAPDDPVRPGRIYVDGILCELEATQMPIIADDTTQVGVPDLILDGWKFGKDQWVELIDSVGKKTQLAKIAEDPEENSLTLDRNIGSEFTLLRRRITYTSQPYYPNPDAVKPTNDRVDLVYLDVWQRHVTVIEDPDIREEALGGADTTTRLQTVWQVKVSTDILPSLPAACSPDDLPGNWTPAELGGGQLSTKGSYGGSENRLYRVEIHEGGKASDGATFKWSRDDGAVVSPIDKEVTSSLPQKDKIKVSRLGRDQTLALHAGNWVEVGGDESELNFEGERSLIVKIQEDGIDRAGLVLTLTGDVRDRALQDHPKVRRWDQTEASNGTLVNGACSVKEDEWIELEDGVQIRFESSIPANTYRTGDYWVFAVRAATNKVQPLTKAPPQGIRHHYCPLALVKWSVAAGGTPTIEDGDVLDCRDRFGPHLSSGWLLTGNSNTDPLNNFLGTTDNQPLSIRTNKVQRILLTEGGNVGIGTQDPVSKLHVVGPGDSESEDGDGVSLPGNVPLVAQATISDRTSIGILNVNRRQAFSLSIDGDISAQNARGVPTFWDKYDGGWHSSISLRNGNVGIGTIDPDRWRLTIQGGELISFKNTTGATKWHINDWRSGALGSGNLNIAETGIADARLYLKAGGNVGIGTDNPQARLDVSGSGGAVQCCAPAAHPPTLSLAEASDSVNRQAWLQFRNMNEAEAYIRLAGAGPAGSGREGQRRLEIGDNQGARTGLRIVGGGLSLPKLSDGYAEFTNESTFVADSAGQLKLNFGYQPSGKPAPWYEFAVGHKADTPWGMGFEKLLSLVSSRGVNSPPEATVGGDLRVQGKITASGGKGGYVVDNFINRGGDMVEQGDVLVVSSSDSSHYYGTNNTIPLIEGDLTDMAYDSRVCGIVDGIVTENELPLVEETQAPSLEDVAREVNATEAAVKRAVKLGVNPFKLEGTEGTGSGGRILVTDVETAAAEGKVSSTSGLVGARPAALLNPLVIFAGEITRESDATKVENQQMGTMVTLGAFAHCKVDADIASIEAGDLLTTSPTRRHAQKVLEPEKAAGAIVGKALASLDRGKGKIPVLVMLQ